MYRVFVVLFLMTTISVKGQTGWSLSKEKDGVRVYTKPISGKNYKAFRAVTEMAGTISQIMQILRDVNHYREWVPYTEVSEIVKKEGDSLKCYLFTDVPWPVSDRDGYYRYQFQYIKNSMRGQVAMEAIPDFGKEREGVIRIKKSKGSWDLQQVDKHRVRVIYEVNTDPGGSVPTWLASTSVTTVPYKTLKSLEERVKRLFKKP